MEEEEGKMATYISKKTGRREVGGQPPPRIRTGDEIHLPFPICDRQLHGLASWQIIHEWCQEIECIYLMSCPHQGVLPRDAGGLHTGKDLSGCPSAKVQIHNQQCKTN